MNNRVQYWIDIADYDLETARAMLATGRYLYVGFMCHQVIEKTLKAYWSKVLEEPPLKIHTLNRLAEKTGLSDELSDEQWAFIDELTPLNIESRYPEYKAAIASGLNREICEQIITKTENLQQWIKSKL